MEGRRKSTKNIDMDQRKGKGVGIISVAGTHGGEKDNFKEKLSNAECFQMVEENKEKSTESLKSFLWELWFQDYPKGRNS